MAFKKQHMKQAEELALLLPHDMDDAWAIMECLALILERATKAEMEKLPEHKNATVKRAGYDWFAAAVASG